LHQTLLVEVVISQDDLIGLLVPKPIDRNRRTSLLEIPVPELIEVFIISPIDGMLVPGPLLGSKVRVGHAWRDQSPGVHYRIVSTVERLLGQACSLVGVVRG